VTPERVLSEYNENFDFNIVIIFMVYVLFGFIPDEVRPTYRTKRREFAFNKLFLINFI